MTLINSISLISRRSIGNLLPSVKTFISRVESDGGIVEALSCLTAAIKGLPQADEGRLIYEPYATRVLADSGVLEARNCTIDSINYLN